MKYYLSKFISKLKISSVRLSTIDKKSKIGRGNNIINLKMSKYSYIGNDCTIVNSEIGSFCSIANNCIIGGASHPIDWLSSSPVFYNGKNVLNKNFSKNKFNSYSNTYIGNDVWIGNNVLVKSGVRIGDGAIVGMGSVVTKNVGEYEIWAGNPARLIRKRFSDSTIMKIKNSKWWEFSEENIYAIADYTNNLEEVLKIINERND